MSDEASKNDPLRADPIAALAKEILANGSRSFSLPQTAPPSGSQ